MIYARSLGLYIREGIDSEILIGMSSILQHTKSVRILRCNQEKSNLAILNRKEIY